MSFFSAPMSTHAWPEYSKDAFQFSYAPLSAPQTTNKSPWIRLEPATSSVVFTPSYLPPPSINQPPASSSALTSSTFVFQNSAPQFYTPTTQPFSVAPPTFSAQNFYPAAPPQTTSPVPPPTFALPPTTSLLAPSVPSFHTYSAASSAPTSFPPPAAPYSPSPLSRVFSFDSSNITPAGAPLIPGPPPPPAHPGDEAVKQAKALKAQHKVDEAIKVLREALETDPTHIDARVKLACLYQDRKNSAAAYSELSYLTTLQPPDALRCTQLGMAAQGLGRLDLAVPWYQEAVRLSPTFAIPYSNLGTCMTAVSQRNVAEWHYRKAIELDPTFADAMSNLGNLLKESGRDIEAIEMYQRAIQAAPTHATAWSNLGGCLQDTNRPLEAIFAYRKALALVPHFPAPLANLFYCLTVVCDWPARQALMEPLLNLLRDGSITYPVIQPYHNLAYPFPHAAHTLIPRVFSENVERSAQQMIQATPPKPPLPHAKWEAGQERLRVGYMSSDFGNHPLSQLMQNFFGMHDRTRVEVFGYALSRSDGTAARRLIEAGTEHFHDVHASSAVQIAELVNSHRLHVFVDLNGYTKGARPEVLALRPAPVQVHYMGFAGTMAARFIDYLITDEVVTPPQFFDLYAEKLALMPHSYFVNDHKQTYPPTFAPEELGSRASLGLPRDRFVFACFNQLYKIDPTIFHVWCRILTQTPTAVLWLLQFPPASEAYLRRTAMEKYGLTPDRLVFTPVSLSKDVYMRFIGCSDLVLDTPQYNGHTSGCDALWAGVPILTVPGERMASRVGASLLTALECPELVCSDLEGYERLACRLGSPAGRDELAAIRRRVQEKRLTAPLFATQQWVRDVERLYMAMARRYAAGLPPDHLFGRTLGEDGQSQGAPH